MISNRVIRLVRDEDGEQDHADAHDDEGALAGLVPPSGADRIPRLPGRSPRSPSAPGPDQGRLA